MTERSKAAWPQLAVAFITVMGSIVVAWITTGAKFGAELSAKEDTINELSTDLMHLEIAMANLEKRESALRPPMELIGNGKQLEIDKADSAFTLLLTVSSVRSQTPFLSRKIPKD